MAGEFDTLLCIMNRVQFLKNALFVEGGLVVLGAGLAFFTGLWDEIRIEWTSMAVLAGVSWTIPLLLVYGVIDRFPVGGLRDVQDFLWNTFGPILRQMRWYDILLISILAGWGEELVFRGVLQTQVEHWGWPQPAVWLTTNLIFGLMHAVTPWYVVLAAIAGCYFSFLLDVTGERNLLVPIIVHALYDFVVLMYIARCVGRTPQPSTESNHQTIQVDDDANGNS
ncbi:CPBP family intramembrane glutamic endopeptidase [Thalassoroseus pseudoceratinae]|uniref:CPBP family intramembrane glutamic endopeptidase n=1 Tax=Thalassoroseus pseudoceratinae TaxID=2713176 RepID=UPI00197F4982|nr:CPBP family intramembrane glutamic endopeptidase [Thalassoroseus pseudoceratinae]